MTVSSNDPRKTYSGNGVTTDFATPYFLVDADIKVYLSGVLQTLSTHYTLAGAGTPAGGTVTFLTAPPTGTSNVVIINDPALTQELDLVENDRNPAEAREDAFDKLTIIAQRLADKVARSVQLAETDTATSLTVPVLADRLSKFLAFDAVGNLIAADGGTAGVPVSAFMASVLDDVDRFAAQDTLGGVSVVNDFATLQTINPVAGRTIYLKYHTTLGDGGGGIFEALTGAAPGTYTDDGGVYAVPGDGSACWKRIINILYAVDFGVVADGVEDDTASTQAVLDFAASIGGADVIFPVGTVLTGPLNIPGLVGVIGQGMFSTIFKLKNASNDHHFKLTSTTSYFNRLRDFGMDGNYTNQSATSNGIEINKPAAGGITSAGNHRLNDLWVKNYNGSGIYTAGFVNGTEMRGCLVNYNEAHGWQNSAGDIRLSDCDFFNNKFAGVSDAGYGTQAANCKSWLNGDNDAPTGTPRYPGFWIRSGNKGSYYSGCSAQENYGHGWHLDNCSGTVMAACIADGNSITGTLQASASRIYDGVFLENADNCNIHIHCDEFYRNTNPTWVTQRYGVNIDSSSSKNNVIATVKNHDAGADINYSVAAASLNMVIVNGQMTTTPAYEQTIANVSGTANPFGITLLTADAAFTQATLSSVAPAGTRKIFRATDVTNIIQVAVQNYCNGGTLTVQLSEVGATLVLESNGSKWELISIKTAPINAAISAGVITAQGTDMNISNEGGAASDDLDTINGGFEGAILTISPRFDAQTVVAKDGTGNLRLSGDFSMDHSDDTLVLKYRNGVWKEITRSDNAT